MIQLVSQVCPPSAENPCSHRADTAVMPDQMNRTVTGLSNPSMRAGRY
jgi:hypothetical protein